MSRGYTILLGASLFATAMVFVHTFLAADGWSRRQRVRRDLTAVEGEIAADEARAAELRAQIEALRSRPEVQERIVRDELGYVRPADLVLELEVAARPR